MNFVPQDFPTGSGSSAFFRGAYLRRLVRAAGNVRVLLLGKLGPAGAHKATRPIATGTFSFPAFRPN